MLTGKLLDLQNNASRSVKLTTMPVTAIVCVYVGEVLKENAWSQHLEEKKRVG